MDDLQTKGLIDAGTRRDMVRNQLVLIVPASNTTTHTFEELLSPSVKVVALGEPRPFRRERTRGRVSSGWDCGARWTGKSCWPKMCARY